MSPKGYATALHHGLQLQASSIYLFFTFGSLLAFLKFVGCELFIFCSNFIQGFILRLQSSVAYIVHLSHIFKNSQFYYIFKHNASDNSSSQNPFFDHSSVDIDDCSNKTSAVKFCKERVKI